MQLGEGPGIGVRAGLDTLDGHAGVIGSLPALDDLKPQLLDDNAALEARMAALQA